MAGGVAALRRGGGRRSRPCDGALAGRYDPGPDHRRVRRTGRARPGTGPPGPGQPPRAGRAPRRGPGAGAAAAAGGADGPDGVGAQRQRRGRPPRVGHLRRRRGAREGRHRRGLDREPARSGARPHRGHPVLVVQGGHPDPRRREDGAAVRPHRDRSRGGGQEGRAGGAAAPPRHGQELPPLQHRHAQPRFQEAPPARTGRTAGEEVLLGRARRARLHRLPAR